MGTVPSTTAPQTPQGQRAYNVYAAPALEEALAGSVVTHTPDQALTKLGEDLNLAGRFIVVAVSSLNERVTGEETNPSRFVRKPEAQPEAEPDAPAVAA